MDYEMYHFIKAALYLESFFSTVSYASLSSGWLMYHQVFCLTSQTTAWTRVLNS
jgi:hypothetical protein